MTPFHFEHDFRAPSVAVLFSAYFDPGLIEEHDRLAEISHREVLELDDREDELHRVCKVVPQRQLPAVLRRFVAGDMSFVERILWKKREDRIEQRIEPAIFGGRVEISAIYRLAAHDGGVMRRTYDGQVSVRIHLLGGRIERTLIEEMDRSMQTMAATTQRWLDDHYYSGVILAR
ncbi:MAG: DUF2505 domain-containing protein [Myxococcota bacterium]